MCDDKEDDINIPQFGTLRKDAVSDFFFDDYECFRLEEMWNAMRYLKEHNKEVKEESNGGEDSDIKAKKRKD